MTGAVITLKNLSCRLGAKTILRDVSLTVGEGEYLSVIGPNGAGKTTLLRCMNGLVDDMTGEVRVMGRPVRGYSRRRLASEMCYVPQSPSGPLPFTVREFVAMGRYPHLSPFTTMGERDREAVERALSLTEMEAFSERFMDTLSGGERQKVFIAAALAQEARIFLLDEPTTFLDPGHSDEVQELLTALNSQEGITIVSVTHDINAAAFWSGRVVALSEGKVVYDGPSDGVMDNSVLEPLYGKTFIFAIHPATGRRVVLPGRCK